MKAIISYKLKKFSSHNIRPAFSVTTNGTNVMALKIFKCI